MRNTKQKLLTTEDLAEQLGFSVRTITGWVCAWNDSGGQEGLPGLKIGRGWRFDPSLIDDIREGRLVVVRKPDKQKKGPPSAVA